MWRRGAAWAWGQRGAGTAVATGCKCGAEPRGQDGRPRLGPASAPCEPSGCAGAAPGEQESGQIREQGQSLQRVRGSRGEVRAWSGVRACSGSGGAGAGSDWALAGGDRRARPCLPAMLGWVKGLVSSVWLGQFFYRSFEVRKVLVLDLLCNPHSYLAGPVRPVGAAPTSLSKISFSPAQTH